jgi:hypothetical protein
MATFAELLSENNDSAISFASHLAESALYVTDYGADKTGVDDVAAAVVAAIAALPASGGDVWFPEGIYNVASKISIAKSNVRFIMSKGAYLTGTNWFESNGYDNIEFIGMRFIGFTTQAIFFINADSLIVEKCYFEDMGGGYPSGGISAYNSPPIHLSGATNVIIKNNEFYDIKGDNVIRIESNNSFVIEGNTIDTTNYKGITFSSTAAGNKGMIKSNIIQNIGVNHPNTGIGTVGVYSVYDKHQFDVDVIGNYFLNVVENAIEGSFGKISENTIDTAGYRGVGAFTTTSGCGISPYASKIVSGNIISNCLHPGIKIFMDGTYTEGIRDIAITGNYVFNCSETIDQYGISVSVTGQTCANVRVESNVVYADAFTSLGIYVSTNTGSEVTLKFNHAPVVKSGTTVGAWASDNSTDDVRKLISDNSVTTTSVYGIKYVQFAQTVATNVTAFTGAKDGQELTILFSNGNTTIVNGSGMRLSGAANFTGTQYDTLTLKYMATSWYEVSRSAN